MLHRGRLAALVMGAVACGGEPPELGGWDTGAAAQEADDPWAGNAGGEGAPEDEAVAEQPAIETLDVVCYEHTVGDHNYVWMLTVFADDPQGVDTIEPMFEGITLRDDLMGRTLHYTLACGPNGLCTGSWLDTDDAVQCLAADQYTVTVEVLDEDGNWSAPRTVTPIADLSADTGA